MPFANGAPNLTVDVPAMIELSKKNCGAHLRQGLQDRPDLHEDGARAGLQGAPARRVAAGTRPTSSATATAKCSTIRSRSRPRKSRSSASLEYIFQPELYPDLYKDIYHKVRINYYPPRGDNKEGWDNIDIFGWLGYPMQIKVDFLCRDSILAAPIALDLVLFLDLAKRTPELQAIGIQEWLSFYLKSPQTRAGALSGARSVHPVDEAEEHAAPHHGRRPDHAPRPRVLRLRRVFAGNEAAAGLRLCRIAFVRARTNVRKRGLEYQLFRRRPEGASMPVF